MIVQSTIAQVTTRKISDGSLEVTPDGEKTPLDSATPEIRKPISPRAHIARARMSGGYMERGFGGFGELLRSRLEAGTEGTSVVAEALAVRSSVAWAVAVVAVDLG